MLHSLEAQNKLRQRDKPFEDQIPSTMPRKVPFTVPV